MNLPINIRDDVSAPAFDLRARQVPDKWILGVMGMPTLNIGCAGGPDDYPVILSESVKNTFETGVDGGLY